VILGDIAMLLTVAVCGFGLGLCAASWMAE
jgi:hypothetical protein